MTLKEAIEKADKFRSLSGVESAKVMRTLPESDDPIVDGDNGWNVGIVTKTSNPCPYCYMRGYKCVH